MELLKKIIKWPVLSRILYIAFLLAIIVYTFLGDAGLYKLHSMYKTKAKLKYQIKEIETKIESLENEKVRLRTPEYLESIIRKELGYIKDGEVIYQLTP